MPGLAPTADEDWTKNYIQCNNLCPQGVCMAGNYMLTTAYCMDDLHNSCIFVYNNKTGEFLKTLVLKDQKSHVGGITYDEKNKTSGSVTQTKIKRQECIHLSVLHCRIW